MALERKGALGKTYTNAKALWYDWLDLPFGFRVSICHILAM